MSDIAAYAAGQADVHRLAAYLRALRRAVRPGCRVLDLGTGPGTFAVMAARLGAGHVYAIEQSDVIGVAADVIRENGLEGRIGLFHGDSRSIELPSRVDVIVSDLHGATPLYGTHLASTRDARDRFLSTGGTLIPRSERLFAGLVRRDVFERIHLDAWGRPIAGAGFGRAAWYAVNRVYASRIRPEDVVAPAQCWASWNFHALAGDEVRGDLCWSLPAGIDAGGISLWFEADLGGGGALNTSPSSTTTCYGQLLLPWPERIVTREETVIRLRLRADPLQTGYAWSWMTECRHAGDVVRFRQSTRPGRPTPFAR